MDFKYLFTSFDGRIGRQKFWIGTLILMLMMVVLIAVPIILSVPSSVAVLIIGGAALLGFLGSLAITVKRLHDRDKSGWWYFVFFIVPNILTHIGESFAAGSLALALALFVPAIGISIWAFVEVGLLKGSDGPNRFGSDPLAQG